jgi:hypothetical protein
MNKGADLYSILVSYANKNNSPYVKIVPFLAHLENSAAKHPDECAAWNKWVKDRAVKFWSEISSFAEEGKCVLQTETNGGQIFMAQLFRESLNKVYLDSNENADLPFFNEESLAVIVPESQIKLLGSDGEFASFLSEPGDSSKQILKIIFPDGFSSALVLPGMIPRHLVEMAFIKIQSYLRRYGNKDYAFNKLAPQLQCHESYLKGKLETIILRPRDLFNDLIEGGELTNLFWAHFCSLVKNDIKKKKERLSMDVAAFQAVYIIDIINKYHKSLTVKQKELEKAFKELESCLGKSPYIYTIKEIINFQSSKGGLLLNQYTPEELEAWLKSKTTGEYGKLPELFTMRGFVKDDKSYVLKDKMVALCIRFLIDGRFKVKDAVSKHWNKLLLDYKKEPAMENNGEFEKFIFRLAEEFCPELQILLADPRFIVVYQDTEQAKNNIPASFRIIDKGQLLPYSAVFDIRRKELLQSIKFSLPFWYSMPILSAIIGFFNQSFKKKSSPPILEKSKEPKNQGEKDRASLIKFAAEEIEWALIPPGYTIDLYLENLEDRWGRLIDSEARKNLIIDVRHLARDCMRKTLRVQKQFKPTHEAINQMAYNLVIGNTALASLAARDALILYLELQMIKLLENIK